MASAEIRLADAAEKIAKALEYWVEYHKASQVPAEPEPPAVEPEAPAPAPAVVGEVPAGGMAPKWADPNLTPEQIMAELKSTGEAKSAEPPVEVKGNAE